MIAENFPIFPVGDSTAFTVRHDHRRYIVFHIRLGGDAPHSEVLGEGGTFESRHAAVAAAQRQARQLRCR